MTVPLLLNYQIISHLFVDSAAHGEHQSLLFDHILLISLGHISRSTSKDLGIFKALGSYWEIAF